jgi:ribosomal protein S17E
MTIDANIICDEYEQIESKDLYNTIYKSNYDLYIRKQYIPEEAKILAKRDTNKFLKDYTCSG